MATSSLNDLYALDPVEFERLVGTVFTALGYEVKVTKRSGDEGIDLELRRGEERSLAQCKRYRGTVGQPDIRDFYGVLVHENADRGYFVTTGQFSLAASTWAQGKQIALTDGVDLLSALENSGLVPEPRAKAHPGETPTRPGLQVVVEAALKNPRVGGRILLGGAPPDGHSYDEVAEYLEHRFPKQTDISKGPALRGSIGGVRYIGSWGISDAHIRIIDEFDALPRAVMETALECQRIGIRKATGRPNPFRPGWEEWKTTLHPFVAGRDGVGEANTQGRYGQILDRHFRPRTGLEDFPEADHDHWREIDCRAQQVTCAGGLRVRRTKNLVVAVNRRSR